MKASGTFSVALQPQPLWEGAANSGLGRLSIDKQFQGELEATSQGEMLSSRGAEGSAGYVALEKVTGILNGREGSFVLQHSGTMTRGEGTLSVTVVPDSGRDELEGLEGKMSIEVEGKEHRYSFDYSITTPLASESG